MTAAHPARRERRRENWTEGKVRELGVRTDLRTAADVIGIGETYAYRLARQGEFPVPAIRVGREWVVPVAGLLKLLGLADGAGAA